MACRTIAGGLAWAQVAELFAFSLRIVRGRSDSGSCNLTKPRSVQATPQGPMPVSKRSKAISCAIGPSRSLKLRAASLLCVADFALMAPKSIQGKVVNEPAPRELREIDP